MGALAGDGLVRKHSLISRAFFSLISRAFFLRGWSVITVQSPAEFMVQHTGLIQLLVVLICAMLVTLLATLQPTSIRPIGA